MADDPAALDAAIAASAASLAAAIGKPRRAATDSTEVEAQSLPDQIALDKYLRAKLAAGSKSQLFGTRTVKLLPPGSV
jgi:hypothetical protein